MVEEIKLERLADAPTPRRRRRRGRSDVSRIYGLSHPYAPAYAPSREPLPPLQAPAIEPEPTAHGGPCFWEDPVIEERVQRKRHAARFEY